MGVRMEKEALLRHPWPVEGVTTQYGNVGMCVETPLVCAMMTTELVRRGDVGSHPCPVEVAEGEEKL